MLKFAYQSTGHRSALYAMAESHTPNHILAAGGDGWVTEWDTQKPETGQVIAQVEQPIYAMAVAPAHWPEPILLLGDMLGSLYWVNRAQPTNPRHIVHHSKGLYSIQWLHNEVFTAGGDGILTRWDARTQRPLESIQLSNRALRTVAYQPSRDILAIGASDGYIYYLKRDNFEVLAQVNAHQFSVFSLLWSPCGQILFSGGRDAMLKSWQHFTTNTQAIPAHLATINHIVCSPDKNMLATAGRDKQIKIWAMDDLRLLKVLDTIRDKGHLNAVNRLIWNENGLFSCSDDRTIISWHQIS